MKPAEPAIVCCCGNGVCRRRRRKLVAESPGKGSRPLESSGQDPDAPAAGAKIFVEHCAACHGDDAEGKTLGKHYRPGLHSGRVKTATPGELFWLLPMAAKKTACPPGAASRNPNAGN